MYVSLDRVQNLRLRAGEQIEKISYRPQPSAAIIQNSSEIVRAKQHGLHSQLECEDSVEIKANHTAH